MREKDASPNSLKLLERESRAYNLASDLLPGHPGLFGLSPFADTFSTPSLSSGAPTQSLRVIPKKKKGGKSITIHSSRPPVPAQHGPSIPSHPMPPHPVPPHPTPRPPERGTGVGKSQLEFACSGPSRGFLPRPSPKRRGREGRAAVAHAARSAPSGGQLSPAASPPESPGENAALKHRSGIGLGLGCVCIALSSVSLGYVYSWARNWYG